MRILIVKHGAMGDVVRTSYFAREVKEKYGYDSELIWLTSVAGAALLVANPFINVICCSFKDLSSLAIDIVYSLDDEEVILKELHVLNIKKICGAYWTGDSVSYTRDSEGWFDMGLVSRLGPAIADQLKKSNDKGHAEIFRKIFDVKSVTPHFYLDALGQSVARICRDLGELRIGVNPYAGARWPSKALLPSELNKLIKSLLSFKVKGHHLTVLLFGEGDHYLSNRRLAETLDRNESYRIVVPDTTRSPMALAGYISGLNLLVTSDSLAMHLAIAQSVRSVAFFSPTSAAEIDSFGTCYKVRSTANDYCSYKPNADNSTITAVRLLKVIKKVLVRLYG